MSQAGHGRSKGRLADGDACPNRASEADARAASRRPRIAHIPKKQPLPPVPIQRWLTVLSSVSAWSRITWIVFGQTLGFDFVNYDDSLYVYENPRSTVDLPAWTSQGFHPRRWSGTGIRSRRFRSCSTRSSSAFTPAVIISVNVLLHTIAVLLLFLVLRRMTGALWRSAFVAALFAIHPLRAESVAWISERKDVLSGVFFLLTLGAYVRYARRPSAEPLPDGPCGFRSWTSFQGDAGHSSLCSPAFGLLATAALRPASSRDRGERASGRCPTRFTSPATAGKSALARSCGGSVRRHLVCPGTGAGMPARAGRWLASRERARHHLDLSAPDGLAD